MNTEYVPAGVELTSSKSMKKYEFGDLFGLSAMISDTWISILSFFFFFKVVVNDQLGN